MSRTYRQTEKGNKACHDKQLDKGIEHPYYRYGMLMTHNVGADYFYWMTTPSEWNNWNHTRPRRTKEKRLINKIMSGYIDADDTIFPDGKKPEYWYW